MPLACGTSKTYASAYRPFRGYPTFGVLHLRSRFHANAEAKIRSGFDTKATLSGEDAKMKYGGGPQRIFGTLGDSEHSGGHSGGKSPLSGGDLSDAKSLRGFPRQKKSLSWWFSGEGRPLCPPCRFWLLLVATFWLAAESLPNLGGFSCGPVSAFAAEIPLATDAPGPLSPEESRKRFQLAPGFRIDLVAAEPQLADPVAMAFDHRGGMFVCEIHGYNLEGYLDVLELNKTGVLDREVRRIPAGEAARRQAEKEQYGTVKRLTDPDGDGFFDHMVVWADRLPPCYGVVPARDGVIVLCAPDIVYLADRDADDLCDHREVLFAGFGCYELWSRINNPRQSVDNWIYAASGIQSGGTITGPYLPKPVPMGAMCFRFRSDGTALEPVAGATSGFGQALDDWGYRFLVTNQQHVLFLMPLEYRYAVRNPFYPVPDPVVNICTYGHPARVYPISEPDPWRLARSRDPQWVRFYGETEATAQGFFTAASGQVIYQARLFPEEYWSNHFSVDNAQNLIHRCLLRRHGVGLQAVRATEEAVEFVASREQWFRPVNLVVGPDGALYIVDMYRAIIEDYSAIPRFLQQIYVQSLIAGADRGRIWRVAPQQSAPGPPPRVEACRPEALVALLTHDNAWWRLTAQRLLLEQRATAVVPEVRKLLFEHPSPQARLHALYCLEGLGALCPEDVRQAFLDPHFALRVHGLQLAERWLPHHQRLQELALRLAKDEDAWVRLQAGLSLGSCTSDEALEALLELAWDPELRPWGQAAVLTTPYRHASRLLRAAIKRGETAAEILQPLAATLAASGSPAELADVLARLPGPESPENARLVRQILGGILEGLSRRRVALPGTGVLAAEVIKLIRENRHDAELRQMLMRLMASAQLADEPELASWFEEAADRCLDPQQPLEERIEAASLLASAPWEKLSDVATSLLEPRQPIELQLASIEALSLREEDGVAELLIGNWSTYTPKLQQVVLQSLVARQKRLLALLDALEAGPIKPADLDATIRNRLLHHPEAAIRRRAEKLLEAAGGDAFRQELLAQYHRALELPRDPARGRIVFQEQCSKCHLFDGLGHAVGPDLLSSQTRPDETLIADILDPNQQITVGYRQYTVITERGQVFTGVLAGETATSIILRQEQGVETVLLRSQIEQLEASELSMMPQDMEKLVSPQDVADLLGYLREVWGSQAAQSLVLFDEASDLCLHLNEGDGTLRLDPQEAYAGHFCLWVSPLQRYNARIPGWDFRIRENPKPGEFRYLRFAWKSGGAKGIMLELAADGAWPPAEQPVRRYCAGENTTGWAAVQLSGEAPQEWIVVERDLWQDFGEFTLTGLAPTAMGGPARFDRIELSTRPFATPGKGAANR